MLNKVCTALLGFAVFFNIASAQPVFKGGQVALDRFITENIVYPEYSRINCIGATVKVGFRLDMTGEVDSTFIKEGTGIDLDDEALRVVKMTSGKWQVPSNYNTNSNLIIPITFTPDYGRCTNITATSREVAIANYKTQEQLQDVITNYYKNKGTGKTDPALETQIINLKRQIGYNDQFISDLLDQANQKYKQGDKAGACKDWNFIHNIGSDKADGAISKYCK